MRSSNGGLAYGTSGNPQTHIMQETYAAKVAENEATLKELAPQLMIDEALVAELERDGVEFTRKDMLFVTRDKTGQIVWLEKGNAGSGMGHIKSRSHDVEIAKAFGIPKTEAEVYLRKVISEGSIVRNELKPIGGRMGYERVYYYEGEYCIVTGVGTNGFIFSAYPHRHRKEKQWSLSRS